MHLWNFRWKRVRGREGGREVGAVSGERVLHWTVAKQTASLQLQPRPCVVCPGPDNTHTHTHTLETSINTRSLSPTATQNNVAQTSYLCIRPAPAYLNAHTQTEERRTHTKSLHKHTHTRMHALTHTHSHYSWRQTHRCLISSLSVRLSVLGSSWGHWCNVFLENCTRPTKLRHSEVFEHRCGKTKTRMLRLIVCCFKKKDKCRPLLWLIATAISISDWHFSSA